MLCAAKAAPCVRPWLCLHNGFRSARGSSKALPSRASSYSRPPLVSRYGPVRGLSTSPPGEAGEAAAKEGEAGRRVATVTGSAAKFNARGGGAGQGAEMTAATEAETFDIFQVGPSPNPSHPNPFDATPRHATPRHATPRHVVVPHAARQCWQRIVTMAKNGDVHLRNLERKIKETEDQQHMLTERMRANTNEVASPPSPPSSSPQPPSRQPLPPLSA